MYNILLIPMFVGVFPIFELVQWIYFWENVPIIILCNLSYVGTRTNLRHPLHISYRIQTSMFHPGILHLKMVNSVGRRGTNQLRLLERYLDVLVKHTTEILPPTALVEGTAPSALVEDISLRWFNLSCEHYISISKIRAQHATSRIQETESPN